MKKARVCGSLHVVMNYADVTIDIDHAEGQNKHMIEINFHEDNETYALFMSHKELLMLAHTIQLAAAVAKQSSEVEDATEEQTEP